MLTKSIGDFGEYTTELLLRKEYEKEGISVIKAGTGGN
jgi:hypothetical protein